MLSAAIATASASLTPLSDKSKVAAVVAVFATTMFDTTVVVELGTVYKVVVSVVVAAPRNSALEVVAISYYLS